MKLPTLLPKFSMFLLLLMANFVLAEGNCPAGFYPLQGGCAPIPGGPATNNQDIVNGMKNNPGTYRPPLKDSFTAVAWHPDANQTWAIDNNTVSLKNAEERVLEACNKAMGGHCTIAASGKNSGVALLYKSGVLTDIGWGETPRKAMEDVLKSCSKEDIKQATEPALANFSKNMGQEWAFEKFMKELGDQYLMDLLKSSSAYTEADWKNSRVGDALRVNKCDIRVIGYGQTDASEGNLREYPELGIMDKKRTYVMVAWAKTEAGNKWFDKTWVSSGSKEGYEASKQRLLARCKQDSGLECEVIKSIANGVVLEFTEKPSNKVGYIGETTLTEAKVAMKTYCAEKKLECVAGKNYDYKTPRLEMATIGK